MCLLLFPAVDINLSLDFVWVFHFRSISCPGGPPRGSVSRRQLPAPLGPTKCGWYSLSWWSQLPRQSIGGTIDGSHSQTCKTIKIVWRGKRLALWHSTILHEDWNTILSLGLRRPRNTLSALGSRRGPHGLLPALCDFPSRGAVRTANGEGSKLEGRPGTPLLVYPGSS